MAFQSEEVNFKNEKNWSNKPKFLQTHYKNFQHFIKTFKEFSDLRGCCAAPNLGKKRPSYISDEII